MRIKKNIAIEYEAKTPQLNNFKEKLAEKRNGSITRTDQSHHIEEKLINEPCCKPNILMRKDHNSSD